MRFLLLTGMSGAGKTSVMRYLEDQGVFCVDNLPPMMMTKFMDACQTSGLTCPAVAFAVDVRSGTFFDANTVARSLVEMQPLGYSPEILFMDASDEKLLDRFKETRREHPLAAGYPTLTEAISAERTLLTPMREIATHIIDTSALKPKALKAKIQQILNGANIEESKLRVQVMSFGFKRGLPREADLIYDVRFLPNPFYIPELCRHTGLDEDVRNFVLDHPVTREFMERVCGMLEFLLPNYQAEGKRRLVIGIGCTGGAHRSVAIAEAISVHLRTQGYTVDTLHRDTEIEQARWLTDAQE